jgi:hypothetical protein
MNRAAIVGSVTISVVTVFVGAALAQPTNQSSSLPPLISKVFRTAYPGATIVATTQERDGDRQVFRIDGAEKGRKRTVLYDAGGTVVEIREQVDEKELPQPVAAAMHSHPRAIYVTGLKVTRGRNVEYRLTVRGTRKTAMIAKPDGTVLSFR